MIELFEQEIKTVDRQSSKGNQLKWKNGDLWYKADYTGYEGLAEYVVSHLLQHTNLGTAEFVVYEQEQIKYKHHVYNGVKSDHFLKNGWQIITLERLFKNKYGKSLYESVWKMQGIPERCAFVCAQVEKLTGLSDFATYFTKLMTVDAFFLNEDRHFHNIAVLMNEKGEYAYCPLFDHGACLLSDTTQDYAMGVELAKLLGDCHGKTISRDFDEQLDAAEFLSKSTMKFYFDKKTVDAVIGDCQFYTEEEKTRVRDILYQQMAKYQYLFA